jgi:hypothetical protein
MNLDVDVNNFRHFVENAICCNREIPKTMKTAQTIMQIEAIGSAEPGMFVLLNNMGTEKRAAEHANW